MLDTTYGFQTSKRNEFSGSPGGLQNGILRKDPTGAFEYHLDSDLDDTNAWKAVPMYQSVVVKGVLTIESTEV